MMADGDGRGKRTAVKQACTVLYNRLPPLEAATLRGLLGRLVGPCEVEWGGAIGPGKPMVAGVARFGVHSVVMIALDVPVSREVLARTVGVSPMPEAQRAALMSHRAVVRVLYMEGTDSPIEQLIALYNVATALLSQGGLGILNERAALAQPLDLLVNYLPIKEGETLPLALWVGVVTFPMEGGGVGEGEGEEWEVGEESGSRRYLMRTYGMEQMALPELGMYINDRTLADDVYHTLLNICLYIVEGGDKLQVGPGHRADFLGRTYLFTDPDAEGIEFTSPTGLLLLVQV